MPNEHLDNLGLPPLAGLATYEAASRPGYAVDQSVELLKRFNYVTTCLNQTGASHLARTPEWEIKCGLSLHLWLDAEHSAALRARVAEMREPPLHLDQVPDDRLRAWLDEAIRAEDTVELLVGVYRVIRPELLRCWRLYLAEANPLADHPTCRLLRLASGEEEEMILWGEQAIAALARDQPASGRAARWQAHLLAYLNAAGGVTGDLPTAEAPDLPAARGDGRPYAMDAEPRRDARFPDPFNRAYTRRDPRQDEGHLDLVLLYARAREMDVPEFMAPILAKTRGKPWNYYREMSRQLWDEARHAMMGEVGLVQAGIPFHQLPIEIQGSASLNTEFTPLEAHTLLWGIEQALMARETGKPRELAKARESGNALVVTFQDFDWADEVLHAQIGRRWLVPELGGTEKAQARYDELWPRWEQSMARLDGRSEQQDWWTEFLDRFRQGGFRQPAAGPQ
jgi:hypothetical protein